MLVVRWSYATQTNCFLNIGQQRTTDNEQLNRKEQMTIRKIYSNTLRVGLAIWFSFCMQFGFSQTVQTITDKKDILIGEQIKLTIKASLPLNAAGLNKWVVIPDSISHFEIVEKGKIDTINFKDNSKAIEQTITVTGFDSGRWVFPALPVEFAAAAGQPAQIVKTDSFYVNVSYSPPDSTNQLRDIKPIIRVSVIDYFWYYIIGGSLLLLAIIYLLYRYFKKKKKSTPAAIVSKLTPYDEAMEELKRLDQFNLQNAAEIKLYHTKLSVIFKNYLGRKQHLNLLNKTTSDLLISMKEVNLSTEAISNLATALRCMDAVKFAKYLPLSNQSEDCLQKIKETINLTEATTSLHPKPLN